MNVVGYSKLLINESERDSRTQEPVFEAPAVSGGVKIDLQKGALHGWYLCPQRRGFHSRRRTSDHRCRRSYFLSTLTVFSSLNSKRTLPKGPPPTSHPTWNSLNVLPSVCFQVPWH